MPLVNNMGAKSLPLLAICMLYGKNNQQHNEGPKKKNRMCFPFGAALICAARQMKASEVLLILKAIQHDPSAQYHCQDLAPVKAGRHISHAIAE